MNPDLLLHLANVFEWADAIVIHPGPYDLQTSARQAIARALRELADREIGPRGTLQ